MINLHNVECVDNRRIDEEDINSLAASIGNIGLIQPLVLQEIDVTPLGECYRVIAGRRRYRALMKLERFELAEEDYRVIDTDDPDLVSFVENFERVQLGIDEEIEQLAKLREKHAPAEIATILGKSESFVRQRLQLANLIPELQRSLVDGSRSNLKTGHYVALARYSKETQKRILESWYISCAQSVRDFADTLERIFAYRLNDAPFDTADCAECMNHTGAEPLLFEEFRQPKSEDRCLSQECFSRKCEEHIKSKVEEIRKDNTGVTLITTPGGTIPKGLAKTPHLEAGEYEIVERDVPPEKANAFVMGGDGAGTYCRIADKAKPAEAPAPPPKTLEDRKAELEYKRKATAISLLRDDLTEGKKDGRLIAELPADDMLIKWIAAIGSDISEIYDVPALQAALAENAEDKREEIWLDIIDTVGRSMLYWYPPNDPPLDDATTVCELLGLDWQEYLDRAIAEHPEPEEWSE